MWNSGKIPQDWRDAVISKLYKGKGGVSDCCSYRGISLRSSAEFKAKSKVQKISKLEIVYADDVSLTSDSMSQLQSYVDCFIDLVNNLVWLRPDDVSLGSVYECFQDSHHQTTTKRKYS
ncbi:unnamed protein product [Parnassius apollo]|uniref:(apollo) hypothetical protein n=1 Tax=Parnassius apollo TaxID=110799 RepID=A0A8S3WBX0_PARAO|nr:unnamed protein product [Parnassius apollo]